MIQNVYIRKTYSITCLESEQCSEGVQAVVVLIIFSRSVNKPSLCKLPLFELGKLV
jgi:hypothetical protein